MDVMSKMVVSPEDLETIKVSRQITPVITATGSIDTTEEAAVYVEDLDMFVNAQLTPAVLYLGKLCEENGCSYEWKEGSDAHLTSSAADSSENTKDLTPDEQETTRASRSRLQDLPEMLWELT